jgi:hypothetical protein
MSVLEPCCAGLRVRLSTSLALEGCDADLKGVHSVGKHRRSIFKFSARSLFVIIAKLLGHLAKFRGHGCVLAQGECGVGGEVD